MTEKPRLSFWQTWNMSFGFFTAIATLMVKDDQPATP